MPTDGWFKAHRSIFRHPLFMDDPACRAFAFMDLVGMAEFEPKRRSIKGQIVEVQRGEFIASVRFLSDRWKWSHGRVQRFLAEMESEGMIGTVSGTPSGTVYCVIKYDTYQDMRYTERDTDGYSNGTATVRIEEEKNLLTNELTITPAPEVFTKEEAIAQMRADAAAFIKRVVRFRDQGFYGEVRGVISGDSSESWRDGKTYLPVEWTERPARLRQALDALEAGKAKTLHYALVFVHSRKDDPITPRSAAEVEASRPAKPQGEWRGGATGPALVPTSDHQAVIDRLRADHPAIFAEELAAFERTNWWASQTTEQKAHDLKVAIRDRLARPLGIVA